MAATTPARETQEAPGKDEDTGRRGHLGLGDPRSTPTVGSWGRQAVEPAVFQVAMVSGIDFSTE